MYQCRPSESACVDGCSVAMRAIVFRVASEPELGGRGCIPCVRAWPDPAAAPPTRVPDAPDALPRPPWVARRFLWYLLRERKFDQDAITDLSQLKSVLGLSDEQVADALSERSKRVYEKYGTLIM